MQARNPTLIINPRSDRRFVALAHDLVRAGATTAARLQAALRRTHPKVDVHERGLAGEITQTWYVYREGRWVPGS